MQRTTYYCLATLILFINTLSTGEWGSVVHKKYGEEALYLNVAWNIKVEPKLAGDNITTHINPHIKLGKWICTRDQMGGTPSYDFGDHRKDWDFLVMWRDTVLRKAGKANDTNWLEFKCDTKDGNQFFHVVMNPDFYRRFGEPPMPIWKHDR